MPYWTDTSRLRHDHARDPSSNTVIASFDRAAKTPPSPLGNPIRQNRVLGCACGPHQYCQIALPRPHSIHTGSRKAITAASRREATTVIEAENEYEPTLGAVFNEIGLITLSGGVPIVYKGEVIGGIGIAGSPGEDQSGKEFDDICAEAGIAAISENLK